MWRWSSPQKCWARENPLPVLVVLVTLVLGWYRAPFCPAKTSIQTAVVSGSSTVALKAWSEVTRGVSYGR